MPLSRILQVPPGSLDLLAGDVRRRRRVQHAECAFDLCRQRRVGLFLLAHIAAQREEFVI